MSASASAPGRSGRSDSTPAPEYTCGWCGRTFREDRGQPACRACPLTRLCGQVRCPHCGWENPARPGWRGRSGGDGGDDVPTGGWWSRLTDWLTPDDGGAP